MVWYVLVGLFLSLCAIPSWSQQLIVYNLLFVSLSYFPATALISPLVSVKCYRHCGNDFNLRAKLEDLHEVEKFRIERKQRSDLRLNFPDASKLLNAAIVVVKLLGWAWRWAEWWVDYNSSWEPLLEPGQVEAKMTSEELKRVDSTRESRCADARRCRLVALGAAFRNRLYDEGEDCDRLALDRALRAVLNTRSLVGPLTEAEIDFHAEWLGRAYRSKSRLLFLGDDKIPVESKHFCLNKKDQSPKFEVDKSKIPGKQKLDSSNIFESDVLDVDDFLETAVMTDQPAKPIASKSAPASSRSQPIGKQVDGISAAAKTRPLLSPSSKRKRSRPPVNHDIVVAEEAAPEADILQGPIPKKKRTHPPVNRDELESVLAAGASSPPEERRPGRLPLNRDPAVESKGQKVDPRSTSELRKAEIDSTATKNSAHHSSTSYPPEDVIDDRKLPTRHLKPPPERSAQSRPDVNPARPFKRGPDRPPKNRPSVDESLKADKELVPRRKSASVDESLKADKELVPRRKSASHDESLKSDKELAPAPRRKSEPANSDQESRTSRRVQKKPKEAVSDRSVSLATTSETTGVASEDTNEVVTMKVSETPAVHRLEASSVVTSKVYDDVVDNGFGFAVIEAAGQSEAVARIGEQTEAEPGLPNAPGLKPALLSLSSKRKRGRPPVNRDIVVAEEAAPEADILQGPIPKKKRTHPPVNRDGLESVSASGASSPPKKRGPGRPPLNRGPAFESKGQKVDPRRACELRKAEIDSTATKNSAHPSSTSRPPEDVIDDRKLPTRHLKPPPERSAQSRPDVNPARPIKRGPGRPPKNRPSVDESLKADKALVPRRKSASHDESLKSDKELAPAPRRKSEPANSDQESRTSRRVQEKKPKEAVSDRSVSLATTSETTGVASEDTNDRLEASSAVTSKVCDEVVDDGFGFADIEAAGQSEAAARIGEETEARPGLPNVPGLKPRHDTSESSWTGPSRQLQKCSGRGKVKDGEELKKRTVSSNDSEQHFSKDSRKRPTEGPTEVSTQGHTSRRSTMKVHRKRRTSAEREDINNMFNFLQQQRKRSIGTSRKDGNEDSHGDATARKKDKEKIQGAGSTTVEDKEKIHGAPTSRKEGKAKIRGAASTRMEDKGKIHAAHTTRQEGKEEIQGAPSTTMEYKKEILGVASTRQEGKEEIRGAMGPKGLEGNISEVGHLSSSNAVKRRRQSVSKMENSERESGHLNSISLVKKRKRTQTEHFPGMIPVDDEESYREIVGEEEEGSYFHEKGKRKSSVSEREDDSAEGVSKHPSARMRPQRDTSVTDAEEGLSTGETQRQRRAKSKIKAYEREV